MASRRSSGVIGRDTVLPSFRLFLLPIRYLLISFLIPAEIVLPLCGIVPSPRLLGAIALTAANLLFEMLCVMPGVQYSD